MTPLIAQDSGRRGGLQIGPARWRHCCCGVRLKPAGPRGVELGEIVVVDFRLVGPAHGVGDDPADFQLVVDREVLVARAEVEDAAFAAPEATAAAEDFAAAVGTDEDQFLRCRDVEDFAVHLRSRDDEAVFHTGGDRVARIDSPDHFAVVGFTPT